MNCIELMVEEHKYIKRVLAVIRKYCYRILNGETVQYEGFYKIIDFVRNYADKHHHGKEETMLFNRIRKTMWYTSMPKGVWLRKPWNIWIRNVKGLNGMHPRKVFRLNTLLLLKKWRVTMSEYMLKN